MKKILLALFFVLALSVPLATQADGGLMPSPGYWIAESDQKAVIVFENNIETMVLSTTFQGNAKDFSWIVPTPAKPTVDKGSYGIFEALQELTSIDNNIDFSYSAPSLGVGAIKEQATVNVIEQKKIDIYDISVLESNNQDALYKWLKDNGYNYPEYGKSVLDDYIRNKWYFTAVKINPQDLVVAGSRLNTGTITPLKFTFKTDKIVYPLKISSITMNENGTKDTVPAPARVLDEVSQKYTNDIVPPIPSNYVSIQLYIFADHKKEIDGFSERYANWVDTKDIKKLAFDDNGNPWYSPSGKEMFLTSLSRSMNTSDMRNDLFPIDADNNDIYPPSHFWENVLATILIILLIIISPFFLIYIILMLLFIFIKSRTAKVLFLVTQGLIALFGAIVSVLLAVYLNQGAYTDIIPVLYATAIMTLVAIIGLILEIILGKRKQIL